MGGREGSIKTSVPCQLVGGGPCLTSLMPTDRRDGGFQIGPAGLRRWMSQSDDHRGWLSRLSCVLLAAGGTYTHHT